MPVIDADGCPIYVEVEGSADAPVLMLSNSLGTDLHLWDDLMPAFAPHYRVVRYDRRGHGRSGVPKGPYTMERLGRDAVKIIDALGIKKVNWIGLSMGGMVGQWMGANAADRIEKLVLSNTTSYYWDKGPWNDRIRGVREGGIAAIADRVIDLWCTKDFQKRAPAQTARLKAMLISTPAEGYIACCEALRDMDLRADLPKIKAKTLIIAGKHDQAANVAASEFIQSQIPNSRMAILDAAHISAIEQPEAYAKEALAFLAKP